MFEKIESCNVDRSIFDHDSIRYTLSSFKIVDTTKPKIVTDTFRDDSVIPLKAVTFTEILL